MSTLSKKGYGCPTHGLKYKDVEGEPITKLHHMNLMAGHRCPTIHQLNPKVHVEVKYDQLKAIKPALRV